MNESLNPDTARESHIAEIKGKRNKKEKYVVSVRAVILILIFSTILSTLSGAGGAFLMFGYLKNMTTADEDTTANEFIISEETTTHVQESTSDGELIPEENVSEDMPATESSSQESTTEALPVLSKGEIYSYAVNSIMAIQSISQKKTSTWLGTYTETVSQTGTGFAVTDNGYIVTNNHVVQNAQKITVTDYSGKQYSAEIIGTVPENDFAVIKINTSTLPVTLGRSSSLKVGDDVMLIGNALGELSYTFTDGIVSHLSREVNIGNDTFVNMFQTNAAINHGNSGGPVYNMDGEVVGIATAKLSSEKIEGLGFCIPIDDVKDMMADIILYGYVTGKPLMGITVQTVTSTMSSRYSLPTGCYIVALDKDSPCYKAGIRSGDVITKIGNKTISKGEDIKSLMEKKSAGDTISIECYREGKTQAYSVVLDEKKSDTPRTEYSNVFDF